MTMPVKMKDRPADLQPRERLMKESAQALSPTELLAILLRTGTRERDVLALAQAVLTESDGLEGLLYQNMHSLSKINGIGASKACILLAAIELGRRLATVGANAIEVIDGAQTAARVFCGRLRTNEQESFLVCYLDAKNRIIETRELFVGTVNGANVHPRDIFREAVRLNAVSLIICHNHPSGDVRPSQEDMLVTKRIAEAAEVIGVSLLDHIILGTKGSGEYLSFKDKGYL